MNELFVYTTLPLVFLGVVLIIALLIARKVFKDVRKKRKRIAESQQLPPFYQILGQLRYEEEPIFITELFDALDLDHEDFKRRTVSMVIEGLLEQDESVLQDFESNPILLSVSLKRVSINLTITLHMKSVKGGKIQQLSILKMKNVAGGLIQQILDPPVKENVRALFTENWRVLNYNKITKELKMITPSLNQYRIYDTTIEDIHDINFNNKQIVRHFTYLNNILACPLCIGKGIVDWVTKARGESNLSREEIDVSSIFYDRDPDGPVHIYETPTYIRVSPTPKVPDEGYEICPECHGIGIYASLHYYESSLLRTINRLEKC